MSGSVNSTGVVPATLSFFAIYNPSLSSSDDFIHEQIVYYYDKQKHGYRHRNDHTGSGAESSKEKANERLRHIGLAQGMIQFAAEFSDGAPIESVETEKTRTIIHNLEEDWWLLASVDLTCVNKSVDNHKPFQQAFNGHDSQYSAREVSPPTLLLQQALRAHQIFLLHHGTSLTEIWSRLPREKFCDFLKRFWDGFLASWDVMLHGNPSVDIYNGLKLSVGGELGLGTGEEDWGSGEREVLEGFVKRIDGLVDLIAARYEHIPMQSENRMTKISKSYGTAETLTTSDGVIFSGVGALSRHSVRNISAWIELLAMHGSAAYGVQINPTSNPQRKRSRKERFQGGMIEPEGKNEQVTIARTVSGLSTENPAIPAPIVRPKMSSKQDPTSDGTTKQRPSVDPSGHGDAAVSNEIMKYLTLGVYGSSWGIPSGRPAKNREVPSFEKKDDGLLSRNLASQTRQDAFDGYFLIGLLGSLEEDMETEDETLEHYPTPEVAKKSSNRISVRHLFVERDTSTDIAANPENKAKNICHDRLRVIVYVQPPFVFTFLFEQQTDLLAISSFYRSLHHQLGPLQRPLLNSTDPVKIAKRVWDAVCTKSTVPMRSTQPIRELLYDPARLTLHTTIPDIPEPGLDANYSQGPWTRVEALSVHSQILNTYVLTHRQRSELERTCKTSRGWWIVWMRLPDAPGTRSLGKDVNHREAFLIRKSSDYMAPKPTKASSGLGFGWSGGSESTGPAKLAEGIGIDARQYVNGLLSLNR